MNGDDGNRLSQNQAVKDALDRAIACHKSNDPAGAEKGYQSVLATLPTHPVALHLLGVLYFEQGKQDRAAELIAKALSSYPGYVEAYNSLGVVLRQQGKDKDALGCYQQAISLKPDFVDAHMNLGNTLLDMGDHDGALHHYQSALKYNPNNAQAHYRLGTVWQAKGQSKDAEISYRKAITLNPNYAEAHNNLGMYLNGLSQFQDAADCFRKAITASPDNAGYHNNYGNALSALDESELAISSYKEAIRLDPDNAEAFNNLGTVYRKLNRLKEAQDCIEKALIKNASYPDAYNNLGNTFLFMGDFVSAEKMLKKCLALAPDHPPASKNLALTLLSKGQFEEGWKLYEKRFLVNPEELGWRDFPQPEWDGSDLRGKTILVWGEQGLGDEIIYASLYPEIIKRGGNCIFECSPKLIPLFERSFPGATIVAKSAIPDQRLLSSEINYQCSCVSLMQWLMTSLDQTIERENYLVANESKVQKLKKRYQSKEGTKVVGLGWHTQNPYMGLVLNFPFELFDEVLKTPGIQFVDLQYGDRETDRQNSFNRTGTEILKDYEIDPLNDIDTLAAQIASMDLVISNVNSTAVLASALSVPVWGLLPKPSNWRWGNSSDHCLWYPSMRLFRQHEVGNWQSAFDRLTPAFKAWAAETP